LHVVYLAVEGP